MKEHLGKKSEDPTGLRYRRSRVPLRQPVRLPYARIWGSIETATANISESGMLIQTARIPVGASFDFSILLGDGFSPIQGGGEVIWLSTDESGVSTGMGVRFAYLSDENSKLLRRIVAAQRWRLRPSISALQGSGDAGKTPKLWYSARNRETLIRLHKSCERRETLVLKESMDDAGVCVLAVPPISLRKLGVLRFRLAQVGTLPTDEMPVLLTNNFHEVGLLLEN